VENYRSGQFWASWFAYISFLRDSCLWENEILENFKHDENLGLSCGWVWWHEDVCVISDRPAYIGRDSQGRLHGDNRKAIEYPDGWGFYSVHGVVVDEYVVMTPEKITVDDIEKESNAEVRRVKIDKYGQDRFLKDSNATMIHKDEFGKLWRKEVPNDENIVMVEVLNSTPEPDGEFKTYFIRVDPNITTAHQAVSWTFGKEPKQYSPQLQS